MVILNRRRSPARRGLGANAPRVRQRTAEHIPNQLKFSAPATVHRFAVTASSPPSGSTACPARAVGTGVVVGCGEVTHRGPQPARPQNLLRRSKR